MNTLAGRRPADDAGGDGREFIASEIYRFCEEQAVLEKLRLGQGLKDAY